MSEMVPLSMDELDKLTNDQIYQRFEYFLGHSILSIVEAARAYVALKARGYNLERFDRTPIARFFPWIASERLLPEVWVAFRHSEQKLSAISTLPVLEQRRLAVGDKPEVIEIAIPDAPPDQRVKALSLIDMTARQVKQVIVGGRVLSIAEQMAQAIKPPRKIVTSKPIRFGKCEANFKTQTVTIGKEIAPAANMIEALRRAGMIS